MIVAAVVLTVLLLLVTLPWAVGGLTRAKAGLARLDRLTGLGLLEGRNLRVATYLGVLHLVGSVAVVVGLFRPRWGIYGGMLEGLAFFWVVQKLLSHDNRWRALTPYLLFTALALAVAFVDALRPNL